MMNKIMITPFDNLLEYQPSYNAAFVQDTIMQQGLNGLRIFTDKMQDKPPDLDFLCNYTFLKYLNITTAIDYDFAFLKRMPQLEVLTLNVWGNKQIDLSNQKKLKSLTITWRKNICGLDDCLKLERVCLIEWKEKNLSTICNLENLRELRVKTASINSLDGLQDLQNLEYLLLGNCRNLVSIRGLNGLQNLKSLELWSCSKIVDYDQLYDLPSLVSFEMTDCKNIPSINFINRFPKLKRVTLSGNTFVEDKDISPLERLTDVFYGKIKLAKGDYKKK